MKSTGIPVFVNFSLKFRLGDHRLAIRTCLILLA